MTKPDQRSTGDVPAAVTWMATAPATPGRYWWRAPDPYGRDDSRQYGMLLLKWVSYPGSEIEPHLRIVSVSSFNGVTGGEISPDGGGWSYSGGMTSVEFKRSHKGVEFWPIAERGPEAFLPDMPGKPAWTPEDPKVTLAKRKTRQAEAQKREKEEAAARAKKISDAKSAGTKLYTCAHCETLWEEDDLVQIRECPHCNSEFNGTENGQACPTCNRRFSRNLTEHGCPDCMVEDGCELLSEGA